MFNRLQIIMDAIWRGQPATRAAQRDIRGLDQAADRGQSSFSRLASTWAKGTAVVGATGLAVRELYQQLEAGAEIELTEQRFGRLSEAMGTSADVMESRLGAATAGLMSDAETVRMATDIMRLGLVETADDVVRLARVSSEMGMDLNELTLALANQSKRRLDQLGIPLRAFNQNLAELEAQGKSTEAAFTEAFLATAEQQIELVGSTAGTTAGDLRRLRANWLDFVEGVQTGITRGLAPALAAMSGRLGEQIGEVARIARESADTYEDLVDQVRKTDEQIGGGFWAAVIGGLDDLQTAQVENITAAAQMADSYEQWEASMVAVFGSVDEAWSVMLESMRHTGELKRINELGVSGAESWFRLVTATDAHEEALMAHRSAVNANINASGDLIDIVSEESDVWDDARNSLEQYDDALSRAQAYEDRREGIDATNALWEQMEENYQEEVRLAQEAQEAVGRLNQARLDVVTGGIQEQAQIIQTLGQAWADLEMGVDDAQERIDEATGEMGRSFRDMALEMVTTTGDFDQVAADYAVALGLMDRETADLRLASQDAAAAIGQISQAVDEEEISPERASRLINPIIEAMSSGRDDIGQIITDILAEFEALTSEETDLSQFDQQTQRMVEKLEAADRNAGLLGDTVKGIDNSRLIEADETAGSLEERLGRVADTDWEAQIEYQSLEDALSVGRELELQLDQAAREREAIIRVTVQEAATPDINARVFSSSRIGPNQSVGTGGDWRTVPPGPPGDSYFLRVTPGEEYNIRTAGQRRTPTSVTQQITHNHHYYTEGAVAVAQATLDMQDEKRLKAHLGME